MGSAVGLGNIWKFPYITGENGGAAFLVVYLLCIIFVGLPVMISEFYIGRKTRKNVMGAVRELNPKKQWKSMGVISISAAYMIMFFYSCVAGWVYSYVFKAIKGDFNNSSKGIVEKEFANTISGPIPPIMWQIIVIAVVSIIIVLGVKSGIEKVTKVLMPILFILIILCDVRALTLSGASKGISFLFKPDFSQITGKVIISAMGLAFFKLSLGMGTMVTYGSYFTEDNNMINTAIKVAISDTIVSILAGLAIFPAVFSFGMKPEMGAGLLFQTMPLVFSKIIGGQILLVLFFILASIAATTAMLSMVEVLIAYYIEEKGFSRKKAVIVNFFVISIIGIMATLSVSADSMLGGFTIFNKGFFDLFDYISSNILLPVGGLLGAILVGHFISKKELERELTNNYELNNQKVFNLYYYILKYITPILMLTVFLSSIGII